ncbi:MAG: GTPase HflX, partial [bacterium]
MRERALLVSAFEGPGDDEAARMDELETLVRSAGAVPIGRMAQRRAPRAGPHLLGSGKLVELAGLCESLRAQVVVVRQSLPPGELRHVEEALPCRVVDRTALILDIFAQRARSREGQLQVELAQLL